MLNKNANNITNGIKLIRAFAAKHGPMLPQTQATNLKSGIVAKLLPKVPEADFVANAGKALISRLLPTAQSAAAEGQQFTGDAVARLRESLRKMPTDKQQRILKSLFGKFVGSIDDITGRERLIKDSLIPYGRGYLDTTRTIRSGSDRHSGLVKKLLAADKFLPNGRLPDVADDVRSSFLSPNRARIGGTVYRGGMSPLGRVNGDAKAELGAALADAIYNRTETVDKLLRRALSPAQPFTGKYPGRVRPLVRLM